MKKLGRLVAVLVVLGLVGGIVFYLHPLWVERQSTHFGLFLSGVQSNYVLTPEGRVHYYEGEPRFAPGHGIPLVLIHGLADRDESWASMLKRLKRAGFHVYAPDLLGAGRSPRPANSDYSIATQEQFVADFIQSIGLQKPDVGGWSMGGWVVMKLAIDHPDMVNRVVVYDGAGLRHQVGGGAAVFNVQTPEDVQKLADMLEPHAKPMPEFVRRDALRTLQSNAWITSKAMQSMQGGADLLDDKLGGLKNPVLFVWGGDDRLLPLSIGQEMHAKVPQSELDVVEGCGHLAPKTCPGRVAQATADFLKANPAPQGQTRTLSSMK
jgi:pimeloyl-ACP methyl ester carboxylesterase